MRRMTINLLDEERQALYTLAKQERRDIRRQAAFLIRQELQRIGLLSPIVEQGENNAMPT